MEKKLYNHPQIKVRKFKPHLLQLSAIRQEENGEAGAKRHVIIFDDEEDY